MNHKGFTVVEIIVVIVVVAILAAITIVSYSFMREDAMDTKIRASVKAAGDALALKEAQTGSLVTLGYFVNGMDTLVPRYLAEGYRDGLSSKNSAASYHIHRVYTCGDGSGGFVIYASLNNPTADDIAIFNKLRTNCGHTASQAPDATTANPRYNYAQVF